MDNFNKTERRVARQRSIVWDLPRLLLKSPSGMIGFIIICAVVFIALFADVLTPYEPDTIDLMAMTTPPAWVDGGSGAYLLGTDVLGRDVLTRILIGSRISLIVGIFAVVVAGLIGTVFGILSGYCGGWVDALIMRITDSFHSIPMILFGMVALAVVGPGMTTLICVIGITSWPFYARMIRSETLSLKNQEFVRAARTIGTSTFMIMAKHILPNVMPSFIVVSTLSVAGSILTEATLSFLGLGIQPPQVTWGVMLADGRNYLATNWWISTFPGIALSTTVLGIMLLGNWLRDVLDPKNQGLG
ncbi:MAG: ABC transporter permease [Synergistaceae bacterium]|nr:ABC transporter permease [Synergistaceae bacterium]